MRRSARHRQPLWVACRAGGMGLAATLVLARPLVLGAQGGGRGADTARADTVTKVLQKMKAQSDSNELVPLFGWRDAALAAGFGAATFLFFQVDRHIAEQSQSQVTQANKFLKSVSKPSETLTTPGGYVLGGGLYLLGTLGHRNRVAEIGWHGTESILLAAGITTVLKDLVGRARPIVSADTNPHDFKFGGGFSDPERTSFPSGHTTTAFALAADLASEARAKWPDRWWSEWVIPPVAYAGATVVGVSRMYHNKHWASDVALGAAIGTFSGIKVFQYTHDHPDNVIDRFMLHTTVAPSRHGLAVVWSARAP